MRTREKHQCAFHYWRRVVMKLDIEKLHSDRWMRQKHCGAMEGENPSFRR